MKLRLSSLGTLCLLFTLPSLAQLNDPGRQLAHDIFKELIEINTTDSVGNLTTAAEAMAKRLRDSGYPESDVQVLGPTDRKKNMVARLHGSGQRSRSSCGWTPAKSYTPTTSWK